MPEVGTQPRLSAREKRWQAEDDARTLATSKVIVDDPARLVRAKVAAKRMADQEKKSAKAMDDVSNVKKGAPISANRADSPAPKKKRSPSKPKRQTYNVFQKV